LEESNSDFTTEEIRQNPMKTKNNCTGCDVIPAEKSKKFTRNKKGMGILLDMFNKILEGTAYHKA
jgi:hypothetical protein